jgi:predicted naringenin-chalcone synthase
VVTATVTGSAFSVPDSAPQAVLWSDFFDRHYSGSLIAKRLFRSSGVHTRHGVVNPVYEDVSAWGTGARMERYLLEAMPLGKDAVGSALADAGLSASDVGLFAVTTCTGYATPGLDIQLARDLAMGVDVQRLSVGHMGCYAAVPSLGAVSDFVVARGRPAVLLCLELTSLHVQPPSDDVDQIVAHALFSDAAAAVVLEPGAGAGFDVVDFAARTDHATADHMTWDVTDLGFRMGLSPRVPEVLALHVVDVVEGLLSRHGLRPSDVDGWAVHPGGPRIVDVVEKQLQLGAGTLDGSRAVLRDHGNCSSATVLLILDDLLHEGVPAGGHVLMMAFGPGLTLYAALLRAR